ncbi:acyltransferase, partial [Erwinia amylovora]|nr:acyltransferase [Erwinia amylovora]
SARWSPEDIAPLRATLDHLRSRSDNSMVMGPTVEYTEALPNLLAYQTDGRKDIVDSSIKPEIRDTDRKMSEAMSLQGIRYISVWSIVCPSNFCRG